MTTTIGDLISGLLDAYEREYHDHELATVKTALVVDSLLRADVARLTKTRSTRSRRAVRGVARRAA
jgi:hypothetical protein